ncbi:Leucine-rich repeat, typical subtype [Corchorus olitorius]|uniref:Leucine-rich repeat, typical subtype n=1 Tax=Corchorus olitorius TaxID=93759 RepID=A0A1R3JCD9_9ROSI|nr:Leucine-rich repeat, typical subtype [Corchorus olitorius]
MGRSRILFVFLLFYFGVNSSSLSWPSSSSLNSAPRCFPGESSGLLQFKSSLSLDSSPSSSCDSTSSPKTKSWNETTNCCLWEGVSCDKVTAHVIALDLSCSWLNGYLPQNSSLFLPPRLQRLNLAHNHFGGSLPSDLLRQLVSLTHLNLSFNWFSGLIPSEISLLSELISLDFSANNYDFTIEKHSFDTLARNLSKLTYLSFDGVNMSSVPPLSLLNLTSTLKRLSLSYCQLVGELPSEVFRFPHLQYLDLSSNYGDLFALNDGLTGFLPKSNWTSPLEFLDISSCDFKGQLPASLGNLTQIVSLNLIPNNFEGKIPDVFGSLKKLAGDLNFRSSNFRGPFPLTIFNLTQITVLDFFNNSLEGELPAHVIGLHNLEALVLEKNQISGGVPSWLFALPSLKILALNHNKFLTLPTDDQIQNPITSSLEEIYLGSNQIHGSIPSFLFDLVNLTDLDLSSNNLSGVITSEMLSKPRSLATLDLSNNSLLSLSGRETDDFNYSFHTLSFSSCNISRFPSFLKTAKKLATLHLSNNKIKGSISKWESNGWEQLTNLDLSHNSLTGLEQYPGQNLESVDISSNQLRGPLLAPPPSLHKFLISKNNLTGDIPTLICNLTSLEVLDLSLNNLGGIIPACLGNFSQSLLTINLQMNNFHGQIPAFDSKKLQTLALNDNQLEGVLPRSLVHCIFLVFLNVANNKLNDTFPHWLGGLPNLEVIVLRANRFHGPIGIGRAPSYSSFPKLEIIDLSQNAFTGALPTNLFKTLTAMKFENTTWRCIRTGPTERPCVDEKRNSVQVVMKSLQMELQLGTTHPDFTIIDFSSNQFFGRIPEVVGQLVALLVLNLSHNHLTGFIPPVLGHMRLVESLDLSSNKLGGRIPPELTNLTFLEVLNLSHNNLVGPIPQGKQFDSFDYDSYIGNPGLWGCPLPKKCPRINPIEPPPPIINVDQEDDDLGISHIIWKVAAMGYGCGTVLGLSMGYIVFTTGRPWWIVRKIERDWQIHVTNWFHNRRIQTRRRRNANATR